MNYGKYGYVIADRTLSEYEWYALRTAVVRSLAYVHQLGFQGPLFLLYLPEPNVYGYLYHTVTYSNFELPF